MEEIVVKEEQKDSSFRDRIATVDEKGKRKWIFAQKPKGKFYNIRTYVSWFFFILFFSLPFIEVKGRPLFLFNIPQAKFILFGQVFWPQDFFIFGLIMVTFIIFIVLFTAAFGRLFCGWVCPQTIFMEMFFRKIEYFIEGDAQEQKILSKQPWNREKILKKTAKHLVFYFMSFVIANFFLAYIIGMDELRSIITDPLNAHVSGLLAIVIFSGIFYGVYAYFREQACTVVCPYGRLQSVLLDQNSMIVAYDYKRGEPRGKASKKVELNLGDCVDCSACVRVCPTGIDIRNGTQMECVGCTACIDACDDIMLKLDLPTGLIRYASETNIKEGTNLKYTGRMKFYTIVLILLASLLSFLLITRKDITATVMRTPGMLYQERGTDSISNLYNIKIANKTIREIPLSVELEGVNGIVQVIGGNTVNVKKEGQGSGSFFIVLPASEIKKRSSEIKVNLYDKDKLITSVKTKFLGPVAE